MKYCLGRHAVRIILRLPFLLWTGHASAVCGLDTPVTGIGFGYARYDASRVVTASPYAMEPVFTDLNWQGELWQARHQYLSLEFPQSHLDTPITTGDLHTLTVGIRDQWRLNQSDTLDGALLPTLAVSSNQLKNPDELKLDAFRLDAHLLWHHRVLKKTGLLLGYCLGTLQGEYSAIPVIGFDYRGADWELSLAYPASHFYFSLQPAIQLFSDWSLFGNQWQILDSDLQNRSDVHVEAQGFRAGVKLHHVAYGEVAIFWLHLFDQQMEYLARNGSYLSVAAEDTDGWMIQYHYRF